MGGEGSRGVGGRQRKGVWEGAGSIQTGIPQYLMRNGGGEQGKEASNVTSPDLKWMEVATARAPELLWVCQ
jgi:hypothetical protein